MSRASREQTPANDPRAAQGSGGNTSVSEHFAFPQPGDGEPLRPGSSVSGSHQSRSPLSRTFSRSSSGYFSVGGDSVPSSPLMPNISEDALNDEVWFVDSRLQSMQMAALAGGLRPETTIGRELRRIGDEFNRLYLQRAGNDNAAAPPDPEEHPMVAWMNVLLGRLLQLLLRR